MLPPCRRGVDGPGRIFHLTLGLVVKSPIFITVSAQMVDEGFYVAAQESDLAAGSSIFSQTNLRGSSSWSTWS